MDVKNHFDFGSPFYQSHNGALMSFALDGVGFKVAEFTVKVGKVDSPLVNALAKLTGLPPPFYVTIGATLAFHRQGPHIKIASLEKAVKRPHTTAEWLFSASHNCVWRPALSHFGFDISYLISGQLNSLPTAMSLVFTIVLVIFLERVAGGQKAINSVDGF